MKSRFAIFFPALLAAAAAVAGGSRTATLAVSNMDCAACPITVGVALKRVPGVASAKVDFKSKLAVVSFDPSRTSTEALTKATADAGYPSTVKQVQ